MVASTFSNQRYTYLFYFVIAIGFISLWVSPFLVSLCTSACGLLLIVRVPQWKNIFPRSLALSTLLICGLGLVDFAIHQGSVSHAKLLLLLGLVFVLNAGLLQFKVSNKKTLIYLFLGLAAVVALVNAIAIANYLADKTYLDKMLLQSKSLPIPNMHHIHFGIINAITIIGLLGVILEYSLTKMSKILNLVLLVFIFICFHILSSRTGLIAFYSGAMAGLCVYAYRNKAYHWIWIGPVVLGLTLGAAYVASTSFKTK